MTQNNQEILENEEVTSVDDHKMKEISAVPQCLQGQIKVQTPGGTTVRNIMFLQEKELEKIRSIAAAIEKELNQHLRRTEQHDTNGCKEKERKRKDSTRKEEEEKK